jgi:hypothetical protein
MSFLTQRTFYTVDATQSRDCYGLRIEGDYLGPEFPNGCYAIFDTSVPFKRGNVVAVTTTFFFGSSEKAMLIIGRLIEDMPHQPESAPNFLGGEKESLKTFAIKQAIGPNIDIPVEGLLGVHKCIAVQWLTDAGKEGPRQ